MHLDSDREPVVMGGRKAASHERLKVASLDLTPPSLNYALVPF